MRLSIDTNIIAGFWAGTPEGQRDMQTLVQARQNGDTLLVCGVVYTELCAAPGMARANADAFLSAAKITLDVMMSAAVWQAVADANHSHQQRRRKSQQTTAKRVVADFMIGAHALHRADALITRNPGDFADFVSLVLVVPV